VIQDVDELKVKLELYCKALRENGFDPLDKKVAIFLHTFIGNSQTAVMGKVKEPFTNYLKTTPDLLGNLGKSAGLTLNPKEMSPEDQETLLNFNFAFERYLDGRTLMGTVENCQQTIDGLIAAGVDEIACLVDFGLPFADVLEGLDNLNKLRLIYK